MMQQSMFPEDMRTFSCTKCACKHCLMWWSSRCPYGECFDNYRALTNPYDKAHPGEPPRTSWSNWKKDQAYWCRGGTCYAVSVCAHFVAYEETKTSVKTCLLANVCIYQDGYIQCSIIDSIGCEECYKIFEQNI